MGKLIHSLAQRTNQETSTYPRLRRCNLFLPTIQPSCVPAVASGKAERLHKEGFDLNPKPLSPLQDRGLNK